MTKRLILYAYGKVQGIGYRYEVQIYARSIGITGWVTNLNDGKVQVVAEGNEDSLRKLIDFCYNGVQLAKVKKIDLEWHDSCDEFEGFMIQNDKNSFI